MLAFSREHESDDERYRKTNEIKGDRKPEGDKDEGRRNDRSNSSGQRTVRDRDKHGSDGIQPQRKAQSS